MLLPADRILGAIDNESQHLGSRAGGAWRGSLQESFGVALRLALRLLRHSEHKDATAVLEQLATLKQALLPLANRLTDIPESSPSWPASKCCSIPKAFRTRRLAGETSSHARHNTGVEVCYRSNDQNADICYSSILLFNDKKQKPNHG